MDLITQRIKIKEALPEKTLIDYKEKYGLKDDSEFIRKGYVPEEIKFVEGEKAVISYINTACIDRDAEVTLPEGAIMDAFKENPVVMFGHDYKELPIGKCEKLKLDSKGWQGKTVYANTPRANEIYEYRKSGFPLAESVGFIPIESINSGENGFDDLAKDLAKRGAFKRSDIDKIKRIHKKWLMLEYSDVPIPSNPEALQVAIAKGLILPEVEKELPEEIVTKPEVTDDYVRIPVRECKITATIDISKEQGIKALYCGDEKAIATYLFSKEKGWTLDKAKQWVKEHSKSVIISTTYTNSDGGIIITAHIEPNQPQIYQKKSSIEEVLDEIDYLELMLQDIELDSKVKSSLQSIASKYLKVEKQDMPMDKMKKMREAMSECESMAKMSKDMADEMMSGKSLPVEQTVEKNNIELEEILGEIQNLKF